MLCDFPSSIPVKNGIGWISVPCNCCLACRINKLQEWSTRVLFEAEAHEKKVFITLTYDDEHLPENATLVKKHIQDFNKRVRKRYYGNSVSEYKYYFCGEYGPSTLRPHYHGALLGVDFDFEKWICYKTDKNGKHYYSPSLLDLWPFGFNEVSLLNPTTVNYVTGYILKKFMGASSIEYKKRGVIPPFQLYSQGLGVETLKKHSAQFYEQYLRDDGKKRHFSKYYQAKLGLDQVMEDEFRTLSQARREERLAEDRAKYPDMSDLEYAQLLISKRVQHDLDLRARTDLFKSRSKL